MYTLNDALRGERNMERYRFSDQEQTLMENMQAPFAIYQLVDRQIVTLVVSNGFCELVGSNDREKVYAAMDHDTYRNVHPDDIARLGNAVFRFIKGEDNFESVYRLKQQDKPGYLVIHAYGRHMYTDTGVRLAQIWYANEGAYDEENREGTGLRLALSNALHEESILRASYYDFLTGLPSMTYFFELAEAGREAIRAGGENPVVMYMDFSGMKFYNSRHGFAEGDKLLRAFARILIKTFGLEHCSRFGSDHFAVLAEQAGLDEKLESVFAQCREINDGKTLPVHVGVYPSQKKFVHISVACDRAKLACTALRGTYGAAVNYYSQDLNDDVEKKQYIIENIDRAIREKWIQVYYQGIVRAANGKLCDEEALSRWIDPERGFLSPADFIPALEEAKLIYKLDLFVVEQVLEKLWQQAKAGIYLVPQSVNLSRMDFDSCDIVEEIRRRVDEAGIDRDLITIEITESVIGSDFDFMREQVRRFQDLGFSVWMDDFGSGYSSLDVLQSIHFDLIKLDMRFMQQFGSGGEGRIILTELVRMAMGLGVETVCEGVETEAQVEFLREIGCTKIQGYYYGKPISAQALFDLAASGEGIGIENPLETDYYTALGRVNLYDMAMVTGGYDGDDSLRRYFDTVPIAILEVTGGKIRYARSNKSYRDFIERMFHVQMTPQRMYDTDMPPREGDPMIGAIMRCSRDGNRALVDLPLDDRTTVHAFIRRIAVNPVTGAAAIAIAVLAVMEEKERADASFASVSRALSSDYLNLYYVDTETEQFVEYTPDSGQQDLLAERRGADFFAASAKDAQLFLYKEDQAYFIETFTKENVLNTIDRHGSFLITYRLMMDGAPTYVNMKAVRMRGDSAHIIIGVSNVDAQMRQKEAMARLQAEQTTYSRINALSKDFLCIYTVDPVTDHYTEYMVTDNYAVFNLDKEGDDFWTAALRDGEQLVYPDDFLKYKTQLTREKVMAQIQQQGRFSLQYRLMVDGVPTYVTCQAALVEEKDGPQLIVGVNNTDDIVRREQDYERKLAAARSRANLDTLTGVKNRAAYENLSQTLARQIDGGQCVRYAIALCRVSDLGQVNGEQGRRAGDSLIREACAIICNTFKHSPVFRVAGDMFAVIAQGQDYENIDVLTDALHQTCRESGVAIACGMAKYDGSGSVSSVFERAEALCHDDP